MAYSFCFSLGGNLDFLDFLQKRFKTLTTGGLFTKLFFTTYGCLGVIYGTSQSWSSLVVGDEGWIGPSRKLLCLC